jgi:hypothetical protein
MFLDISKILIMWFVFEVPFDARSPSISQQPIHPLVDEVVMLMYSSFGG